MRWKYNVKMTSRENIIFDFPEFYTYCDFKFVKYPDHIYVIRTK